MTVAQSVNEMYREERRREILKAFNTITREEVLAILESYLNKGILTVEETKTKVKVILNRSCTSYNFIDVMNELDRVCEYRSNSKTYNGWQTVSKFKVADAIIQITH